MGAVDYSSQSFGDNLNLLYSVAPGSMTDTVGFWRDDVFAFLRVVEQFARTVGQHISEDPPNPNDRTLWAGPGARAALADAQAKTKAFCGALMDFANAVGDQAEDVMQRAATARAAFEPLMGQGVDPRTGRRSLTAEQANEMNEQMQKILQALYNAAGQPVCAPVDPIAQSARLAPYTGEAPPPPGGTTGAIHKPQGLHGPAGGGLPADALKALAEQAKQEAPPDHEPQHEGEAPAGGGDSSQAAKGAGDALGQAGQAAGQAAQGAGKGGGADPSQLASGLADALKPKDGNALGVGTDAALDVSDAEAGLPGSVDATAAFAAPIGAGGGLGGGGAGSEPRHLTAAGGHGGPAQQAQPVSQLSSLAQQGQRAAAPAGGMGSMPMGGAPTHGQQGAGGAGRKTPDYLRSSKALLAENPAAFGVVPVVGQLTDEEVALRDQRAEESEAEEHAEGARRA